MKAWKKTNTRYANRDTTALNASAGGAQEVALLVSHHFMNSP